MPEYIKHLVECKCILPQFRKMTHPPFHKFIVFSELEEETGNLKPSFAQCPNCGAVHRVKEVSTSDISNKDTMLSLPTIEDLKLEIPGKMAALLERHECDLPSWQEAKFIIDNEMWGRTIILAKEREGTTTVGKFVIVLGREIYKLENFERYDGLV